MLFGFVVRKVFQGNNTHNDFSIHLRAMSKKPDSGPKPKYPDNEEEHTKPFPNIPKLELASHTKKTLQSIDESSFWITQIELY